MTNLTRRNMMGLTAAALFQTLHANLPAQAAEPDDLPPGLERLSQIMSGKIGQGPENARKPVVTIIETPPHDEDEGLYRFLGAGFLDAAQKANVAILCNELPVQLRSDFAQFENAVAHDDPAGIESTRSNLLVDLGKFTPRGQDEAGASRTRDLIIEYAQDAAKKNIVVAARDPAFNDPEVNRLTLKEAKLSQDFDAATDPQTQLAIQKSMEQGQRPTRCIPRD